MYISSAIERVFKKALKSKLNVSKNEYYCAITRLLTNVFVCAHKNTETNE